MCKDSKKCRDKQIFGGKDVLFRAFEVLFSILEYNMGYSWHIRGIFIEYSYVSVMCRLCIGYALVICRDMQGAREIKGEK